MPFMCEGSKISTCGINTLDVTVLNLRRIAWRKVSAVKYCFTATEIQGVHYLPALLSTGTIDDE